MIFIAVPFFLILVQIRARLNVRAPRTIHFMMQYVLAGWFPATNFRAAERPGFERATGSFFPAHISGGPVFLKIFRVGSAKTKKNSGWGSVFPEIFFEGVEVAREYETDRVSEFCRNDPVSRMSGFGAKMGMD